MRSKHTTASYAELKYLGDGIRSIPPTNPTSTAHRNGNAPHTHTCRMTCWTNQAGMGNDATNQRATLLPHRCESPSSWLRHEGRTRRRQPRPNGHQFNDAWRLWAGTLPPRFLPYTGGSFLRAARKPNSPCVFGCMDEDPNKESQPMPAQQRKRTVAEVKKS